MQNMLTVIWVPLSTHYITSSSPGSTKNLDFAFFKKNPHLRTCLVILERGEGRKRERERNIDVKEKHRLVASCMRPDWEPNRQPFLGLRDNAPTNGAIWPQPKKF